MLTDVSGQLLGSILRNQEITKKLFFLEILTPEDGNDRLSRNVSKD